MTNQASPRGTSAGPPCDEDVRPDPGLGTEAAGSPDTHPASSLPIVLYTSSASGNAKVNSDTRRLLHLLRAHSATYRLVDLSDDTSSSPSDRITMLTASDCVETLPQLHVGGKFIGTAEDVQEMEDFGELKRVLVGEDLETIVQSTKQAIMDRMLEAREWSQKKTVERKVGVRTLSAGDEVPRRDSDLEFL
jgi:glutaredoxin-related protein